MELTFRGVHPCPLELSSYLEASYSCLPVEQASDKCQYQDTIPVNPPSGYIWSDAPRATCPWRVEVQPGQRVNLTLYDFLTPEKDDIRSRAAPRKYAQVREGHKDSTRHSGGTSIQGGAGEGRIRHVYMSDSHQIEIQLSAFNPHEENKPRFLIKYEAVDCPDIKLPDGAEQKRTADTLVVTCPNNKRWTLRCQGTEWIGNVDTCDAPAGDETNVLHALTKGWSGPYSLLIIIGGALLIGLLCGACCLGICLCAKRKKRREREAVAYREHERYNAHPACRRPFKSGPGVGQPNALQAMHPLQEPIPPMSAEEEEYDKPYYANGTVPSWMGYRPLPVPTYEDIMFTQDRQSHSPLPQDPRFSTADDSWFPMAAHPGHAHHPREFDQFNTTGRMMRGKRGLKVGLDGHSKPAPAPPQYFEYDPASREYEKPRPYRHDPDDTPTKSKYTHRRKQSSGDLENEGEEGQKKGNNTM